MIISGMFHPFTGPIYSQDGVLKVKPGQVATREQIITMDWFVDVIESKPFCVLVDDLGEGA